MKECDPALSPEPRAATKQTLDSAMADYLQAEARENARIEAQVCQECGYAAGVHDPLTCQAAERAVLRGGVRQ